MKRFLLLAVFVMISSLWGDVIFQDDMTDFPTGWYLYGTSGEYWIKSSYRYNSPSYSAKSTPYTSYSNNVEVYIEKSVDLSGYEQATLTFYIWQYTEYNYDYIYVEYYYNGSWVTAWSRSGSYQDWQQISVNIPTSATKIRFRFQSDYSVTYTGVYIDDVVLSATSSYAGTSDQNDAGSGGDAGNTISSALEIEPGTYTGYVDSEDRDDYYKFSVNSGDEIKVKIVPPSSADFDLYLYDPAGNLKAYSERYTGLVDSVLYTADASGYWYARVHQYSGSGDYTLYLAIAGSSDNGSDEGDQDNSEPGVKEWTIMVYMNADNDLESYGIQDFNEMEAAGGSNAYRNVIVQIDRASGYDYSNGDWTTCRRYYVTGDDNTSTISSQLIEDIGEVDMGSPQTLLDFVTWTIENYPANKYFLILWDHGDGWYKGEEDESSLFKSFSVDNSSGNAIDVSNGELSWALSQIKEALGRNLDIIGWDACLMSMLEVMDIARNYADYMVASEETEAANGWYYTAFLNALNDNPYLSPLEFGEAVVNGAEGLSTIAIIDLGEVSTLITNLNIFAEKLIEARGLGYASAIQTARNNTKEFYISSHIDLYDFADEIYNADVPQDLKDAALSVKSAISNAVKLYKNSTYYSMCRGVAIFHPSSTSGYDSRYDNLPIASSTSWDEYLKGESGGSYEIDYEISQVDYQWINTYTSTGLTGDDQTINIDLPFTFNFYGVDYNSINICTNGFMSFTSTSTSYNPASIPNTADPNALIAPFWRDLNPAAAGTITYYAGSDKFVVTWTGVKNYANSNTQTFQVILYPDGRIVFQYKEITDDVTTSIGVENQDGSRGKSMAIPSNYTAWQFAPVRVSLTDVEESPNTPEEFTMKKPIELSANPAFGPVNFRYMVKKQSRVVLRIYNTLGQVVETLVDGVMKPGVYDVTLDTQNLRRGIYFYYFKTEGVEEKGKLVILGK